MKKDDFVGEIVWSKKKKDIFVWSYEMNGALNVRFFKSKIIVLGVERSRMCANSITDIYQMIRWNELSCACRIEIRFFLLYVIWR